MGINDIGKVKETTDVELVHPATGETLLNDDGTPMTITVYGQDSSRYKAIEHAQSNRRIMKAQRMGGKMNLAAEEMEASRFDLIVKCTAGWNITLEKEPEPFSEDMVREVYTKHPWVYRQINVTVDDERAFLG